MARPTAIALFLMLCTPLPAVQHGDNPSSAQPVPTDPRAQVVLPVRLPCPALKVPLAHVQERVRRMGSWWRNCGIRGRVPFPSGSSSRTALRQCGQCPAGRTPTSGVRAGGAGSLMCSSFPRGGGFLRHRSKPTGACTSGPPLGLPAAPSLPLCCQPLSVGTTGHPLDAARGALIIAGRGSAGSHRGW